MTSVLGMMYERIHRWNKNVIGICVGATGSGKSYAMLSLANILDPNFNIEKIVFSYNEFIELLSSEKLKKGSFILWDEGGAGIGSRDALTKKNKETGKVIQTFRNLNYGFFLTVPSLDMIDKQIRQLAHYLFKPVFIDRPHHKTHLNVKIIQNNETLGKTYIKQPIITQKNGVVRIKKIIIPLPPKKLREEYEKKKQEFQKELYQNNITKPKKRINMRPHESREIYEKYLPIVRREKEKYTRKWGNRIIVDWRKIYTDYNIGTLPSKRIKRQLEIELNGE